MPGVRLRHETTFGHAVFPLAAFTGEHVVTSLTLAFDFARRGDFEALGYAFARFTRRRFPAHKEV